MRRTSSVASAVATLVCATGLAHAAPHTSRIRAPVGGPLDVATARAALVAAAPALQSAELTHARTFDLAGRGRAFRFGQSHAGLPVLSRGATFVASGRTAAARFASVHTEPATRFTVRPVPTLSAGASAIVASRVAGRTFGASDAVLAWWPSAFGVRLTWAFYAGVAPGSVYAPTVLVDAHTGERLLRFDATRRDRAAKVFPENPIKTPTAEDVTLEGLEVGATTLTSDRVSVFNCIDNKQVVRAFGLSLHVCDLEQTAIADANGDFPYEFERDFDVEDAHAEVAMFHHASTIYSRMVSLGMPELQDRPLIGVVNFRMAEGLWGGTGNPAVLADPDRALEPLDNAFFSPASPFFERFWGVESGALWFGQGTQRDFAVDGDVVFHEFGHAAVDATANLAPYWLLDDQGAHPESGSMNEALADYFSSAITGDARVGEYVGQAFGMSSIRDLENDHTCPESTAGEVHVDSTLFSGALWSARKALSEDDALLLDGAIVTALVAAPSGELAYHEMAELVIVAVEASPLGSSVATTLRDTFEVRGVLPRCERIRRYDGAPLLGPSATLGHAFYVPGKAIVGVPESVDFAPGHFQLRVPVEEGAAQMQVRWQSLPAPSSGLGGSFGGEGTPFDPVVLVKFGEDPIRFEYGPGVRHDAQDPVVPMGGSVTEAATIDLPAGATDAHVMIVNRGDQDGLLTELFVRFLDPKPPVGTGGTAGTAGTGFGGVGGTSGEAGAPLAADDSRPEVRLAGGGCGCRVAGTAEGRAPATALLLASLVVASRRRARRREPA